MPTRDRPIIPLEDRRFDTDAAREISQREQFHEMAHAQRCCQVCGARGPYESHHVIERSELKRLGVFEEHGWDPRNCMRLCEKCHDRHTNRSEPISLKRLYPMHYEFAFEVLGARAGSYLRRMYSGLDPRLDHYRQEWEEARG